MMLLKLLYETQNPEQKVLQFHLVILCNSNTILIAWNITTTNLLTYLRVIWFFMKNCEWDPTKIPYVGERYSSQKSEFSYDSHYTNIKHSLMQNAWVK